MGYFYHKKGIRDNIKKTQISQNAKKTRDCVSDRLFKIILKVFDKVNNTPYSPFGLLTNWEKFIIMH